MRSKKKLQDQKRVFPIETEITKRNEFSDREVGLTHPDLSSFIRLNDQGDIEIFAAPGVGMVISGRSKSISLFADSVRMFTKDEGLRWNNTNFNAAASSFNEPTLVKVNPNTIHTAINGVFHFLDQLSELEEEEQQNAVTILPEYRYSQDVKVPEQKYASDNSYDGLTFEQIGLIEAYSSDYSPKHIDLLVKYIKQGLDFQQAHQKALRDLSD